jgi:hypothetical protein
LFEGIDVGADLGDRADRCVDVELAGEGHLVADVGLVVVDPSVGNVGVDFVQEVLVSGFANGLDLRLLVEVEVTHWEWDVFLVA